MRRLWTLALAGAPACALAVSACTGDDDVVQAQADAGSPDAPASDTGSATIEAGPAAPTCGDAGGAPARALVLYAGGPRAELGLVNLGTSQVDGRLEVASFDPALAASLTDPYLLARDNDTVTRLDVREPWKAVASWNVRGDDPSPQDGGPASANPVAIAAPGCEKAYVLRYNRNRIAIIDTTQATDAGVPTGYVDLGPLLSPGDRDGVVEMSAAVYVPSKKRVYVLLGNTDLTKIYKPTPESFTELLCSAETGPSVIAIDVETDEVVNLGGTAPGGGIALGGYNPTQGNFFYDATKDRLLVLSAGCSTEEDGGVAGPTARRMIEEVDLTTGKTRPLVSLDDKGFPSSMAFRDGRHAAVSFYDGTAYFWDPEKSALGAPIAGGLDLLADDGKDGVVGIRQVYDKDFNPGPLQLVTAPYDGGATVILENPQTAEAGTGYAAGVAVWPRR